MLLLTRERSFSLASTGGPQGSQPLPTGNGHYGEKDWVWSHLDMVWIIAPALLSFVTLVAPLV